MEEIIGDFTPLVILNKFIDNFILGFIKNLNLEDIETDVLFDKESWPRMAGDFTKAIAELLEIPPQEKLSAYHGQEQDSSEKQQAGHGVEEKARTKQGKDITFISSTNRNCLSCNSRTPYSIFISIS